MPYFNKNISINIIMYFRLLVGLYSDIFHRKKFLNFISKAYCVFLSCICTINCIYLLKKFKDDNSITVYYSFVYKLIIFNLATLISILSCGSDLLKFLSEINAIPYTYNGKSQKFETLISLCMFVVILAFNVLRGAIAIMVYGFEGFPIFCTGFILFVNISLSHITLVIMFEVTLSRMKALRKFIENNVNFSHLSSNSQMSIQSVKLKMYLQTYKRLIENNNKYFGVASKCLVLLSLPSFFFYMISTAIDVLNRNPQADSIYITDAILHISYPCTSAVLAELAIAEVDKIKRHIKKQLLKCSNATFKNKLYDGIVFLEFKPLKFSVLRAFCVNITLPLTLISLSTTYTIIAIQFNHLISY